jgi:hypothetical protein
MSDRSSDVVEDFFQYEISFDMSSTAKKEGQEELFLADEHLMKSSVESHRWDIQMISSWDQIRGRTSDLLDLQLSSCSPEWQQKVESGVIGYVERVPPRLERFSLVDRVYIGKIVTSLLPLSLWS